MTNALERVQAARFWRTDRKGVVLVWGMRMFTQTEHTALKTGDEARLVCTTQNQTLSECEDLPNTFQRRGGWGGCAQLLIFLNCSAKRLGPRPRTTIKAGAKSKPRWLPLVIDQSCPIDCYKYYTRNHTSVRILKVCWARFTHDNLALSNRVLSL